MVAGLARSCNADRHEAMQILHNHSDLALLPAGRNVESSLVRTVRHWGLLLAVCLDLVLAGCAGLPADVTRAVSHALPALPDTALARVMDSSLPDASATGFRLMPTPEFALDARLQLALRAQRSLDLQYYAIHDDRTGRYLLRLLRDAAARGVRVRLLLDDLNTSGEDDLLLALAAHDDIEVRLFSPFSYGRSGLYARYAATLLDFGRLNHRMHNKLFIADGVMAVAGGRNNGGENFLRGPAAKFLDLHPFSTGSTFPRSWTSFAGHMKTHHTQP